MQNIIEYITESINLNDIIETSSTKERKNALKAYLKGRYDDYIEKLEKMTKDPKTRVLLDDAFGGYLGDVKLKFSEELISVKRLMPTQNEISLECSLKHGLTQPENIDIDFSDKVIMKNPVITFNKTYIIDGHHRWSEVLCINPDAKIVCLNYDADISIIQMLKATQGAIAASIDAIPVSNKKGYNIYKCSKKEILDYIYSNITNKVVEKIMSYKNNLKSKNDVVKYILANCEELKNEHPILSNAPDRDLMPQPYKTGKITDKESALYKLKTGKVLKT